MFGVHRLGQILRCACFETLLAVALHRFRGERDDGQAAELRVLPDDLHGFVAVHLGHHDVHQDDGEVGGGLDGRDGFAAGAGGEDASCRGVRERC